MANGHFVDTNILVYAYDSSAGLKRQKSIDLLKHLWAERTGFLSIQVLQEFYVTVTRKIDKSITPENAARIIQNFEAWPIHCPDIRDIAEAIRIQQKLSISFWDAMIIWSAVCTDCEVLWTEDLNTGQRYGQLEIKSPFKDLSSFP
ncbi:MAG: PIN domain-containing protein [Syntrophomonas sp.]